MESRSLKHGRMAFPLLALVLAAALLPATAQAQPFGAWLTLSGPGNHGFVNVSHSPALNPTGALTVEAWVAVRDVAATCVSLVGKNYRRAWWIGVCGTTLRSYLKGFPPEQPGGINRDAGVVPANVWTHVAVVFTGTQRLHYVNGELVGTWVESGPLTTSTDPVRIGSDVSHQISPQGAIDEVRIWNVARTQAQIRAAINVPITAAQPGLVAVWGLNGNANDGPGTHDGTVMGSGVGFLPFPVALNCGASTATSLCLLDRFAVSASFRVGPPGSPEIAAKTAGCANDGSGLFWFFNADNWEVLVKAINACTPETGNRFWVFSAATTNVFYRLEVFDIRRGAQKIYFNYSGPPAPAVTDTDAFATCP